MPMPIAVELMQNLQRRDATGTGPRSWGFCFYWREESGRGLQGGFINFTMLERRNLQFSNGINSKFEVVFRRYSPGGFCHVHIVSYLGFAAGYSALMTSIFILPSTLSKGMNVVIGAGASSAKLDSANLM